MAEAEITKDGKSFEFRFSKELKTRLEEKGKGGFELKNKEWVEIPKINVAETISLPSDGEFERKFAVTEFCCANIDTLSAALEVGDACALNFAHPEVPGGGYRRNARAQEEDLCRLLPQLYPSLKDAEYPIKPDSALLTKNLVAVREVGTYNLTKTLGTCSIITAAMPIGPVRPKSGWEGSDWEKDVLQRIRAVMNASRISGHDNLILGAFGCGAFGNPPRQVARLFRELLTSEYRGVFKTVVFAIIDPWGTGNLNAFHTVMGTDGDAFDEL